MSALTIPEAKGRRARTGRAARIGKGGRQRPNVVAGVMSLVWLAVIIVPIYYVVISSFRNQAGYFTDNPFAPPKHPTLDNYMVVIQNDFLTFLRNSVIITVGAVALTVVIGLLSAYVIVRSRGWVSRRTFQIFLLGLAIPMHATIIPIFLIISKLHLYDTLLALILPSVGTSIPMTVLILSNFLRDIPGELFESMELDGAGNLRLFVSLVFPMSVPAIVTVAIYNGLHVWNGFLFPLILTQSSSMRVLPMALWAFQGEYTVNTPAILAAVILSTLPILAAYIFGRRYLISGMTAGIGK